MKAESNRNNKIEANVIPKYMPRLKIPDIDLQNSSHETLLSHLCQLNALKCLKNNQLSEMCKINGVQYLKDEKLQTNLQDIAVVNHNTRVKYTKRLLRIYEGNRDSPLFHNEFGLSPLELLLMRYETYSPPMKDMKEEKEEKCNILCACLQQFIKNDYIIRLPCNHILHSQCAAEQLLYAKYCPICSQIIDLESLRQE